MRAVEDRTISNASIFEENYFFEGCVWLGYAVYGLAYVPWGALALIGQAIIVGSIFGVTGIPPTEKQSLRSKGTRIATTRGACRASFRCRRSRAMQTRS